MDVEGSEEEGIGGTTLPSTESTESTLWRFIGGFGPVVTRNETRACRRLMREKENRISNQRTAPSDVPSSRGWKSGYLRILDESYYG